MTPNTTVSIVSHGHGALIAELLSDIDKWVARPLEIILTINVPEPEQFLANRSTKHRIEVIRNASPKGFGANHNAALARTTNEFFCVLNPDIRFSSDPFAQLVNLVSNATIGVAAPVVTDPHFAVEDHARQFPSVFSMLSKVFGSRPRSPAPAGKTVYYPDWVAGMCMLFRTQVVRSVGGFDEGYFLYYEDVDLCARLRRNGFQIAVCSTVSIVHAARRESRKNLRFARWHLSSAMRYLCSHPRMALGLYRRPQGSEQ
ncbi:MAG: glycosyltransferase family 2 protein [Burkholderiales bacterium]